jgi:hypothetical protein
MHWKTIHGWPTKLSSYFHLTGNRSRMFKLIWDAARESSLLRLNRRGAEGGSNDQGRGAGKGAASRGGV